MSQPGNVLWVGGVRVDDIIKKQSTTVPSQIVERKQALVEIFQELSDKKIQEPIERNFHWEWSKNWVIIAFQDTEAATKVKESFDTFIGSSEKGDIKRVKEDRVKALNKLFPATIDWTNFIVDYKTPKFRGPTHIAAQPIAVQSQTLIVEDGGATDMGLPQDARKTQNLTLSNPHMHHRNFQTRSLSQRQTDASKVGHANANSAGSWQIMEGDGSNVNIEHRGGAPVPEQLCIPTIVSLIDNPDHRVVLLKVDLPRNSPCLIGVVPIAAGDKQPSPDVCRRFTQNVVV
jgi:hypothetical protein